MYFAVCYTRQTVCRVFLALCRVPWHTANLLFPVVYIGFSESLTFSICLSIVFLLLISEFMETIEIIWICLANLTTANYDSTRIRMTTDLNCNICGVMAYFISYLDLIYRGWTCLILYVYYQQVVLSICFRKFCFCSMDQIAHLPGHYLIFQSCANNAWYCPRYGWWICTYNLHRQEHFTLRAIIFVTINDYPALFALLGQIKGKTACVVCVDKTTSVYLTGSMKTL